MPSPIIHTPAAVALTYKRCLSKDYRNGDKGSHSPSRLAYSSQTFSFSLANFMSNKLQHPDMVKTAKGQVFENFWDT